jgi:hypothetical protein
MTIDAASDRLSLVVDRLATEYSISRPVVTACVESAWEAVSYFGASGDSGMLELAERIAERELRLRLGLEREVARLDPENHTRRSTTD